MEDYVTYEQAVRLKELGFNWETHAFYNKECELYSSDNPDYWNDEIWNDEIWNDISAPTLAQAQKWLRNIHGVSIEVICTVVDKCWMYQLYHTTENNFGLPIVIDRKNVKGIGYDTYEEALSAGIDKVLEFSNKLIRYGMDIHRRI